MPTLDRTFSVKNGIDVANTIIINSARNISNIPSLSVTGTMNSATANISTIVTGNALTISTGTASNGNIIFSSNGTEDMRITSSGNVGIGTTNPSYNLEVNGSFAAVTKSFVIPHPTTPGMKLRYGSLEGPENGVYSRGKSNTNTICLPNYWEKLVDPESITVSLTPVKKHVKLYVKEVNKNFIVVGKGFFGSFDYFYTVYAERNDVDKLKVEI